MSKAADLKSIREILEDFQNPQALDIALAAARKAVAAFPDCCELHELLGLLRNEHSFYHGYSWPHPNDAIEELRQAIAIGLQCYDNYLWLAAALVAGRQYKEADLALSKAMEFAGDNPYHYREIACLLRNGERIAEAYLKAVELEPEEHLWRLYLRFANERLGRYEEALNVWKASAVLVGEGLTYQTYLADACVMNGEIELASRLCDEVYQKIMSLDYCRFEEDRPDVMEQYHVTLLVTACMTQALIFKGHGDTNQAIAKFKEALALVSGVPEARCEIALILSEANQQEAAMTQMSVARYHHDLREYYTCGFSERINSTQGIRWILEYMRWPSFESRQLYLLQPIAMLSERVPVSVEAEIEFIRCTLESNPLLLEIEAAREAGLSSKLCFCFEN